MKMLVMQLNCGPVRYCEFRCAYGQEVETVLDQLSFEPFDMVDPITGDPVEQSVVDANGGPPMAAEVDVQTAMQVAKYFREPPKDPRMDPGGFIHVVEVIGITMLAALEAVKDIKQCTVTLLVLPVIKVIDQGGAESG